MHIETDGKWVAKRRISDVATCGEGTKTLRCPMTNTGLHVRFDAA